MNTITTVTIAQALASSAGNLLVVDSAGNIAAALPNAALTARVHSFTLNANATIGAAAAEKLGLLGAKFLLGGEQLVVRDTLAAIGSAANAAGVALASQRQVADAAYNLLNAPPGAFAHVSSVVLLGAPTLNVAQYARLEAMPGFAVDPSTHLTLADSLTSITGLMAAHPAWLLPATALSVRLDGSAIGAYTATQIVALEGHGTSVSFVANGQSTVLPVTASAQDLAGNAVALNHLAGQVGLHFTLTNEGATITATQAAALSGLAGFNPASHALYVVDTGAAITTAASSLFGHGYTEIVVASGTLSSSAAILLSPQLHLDAGASGKLTSSANVDAAKAAALLALPGFSLAPNVTLSVADTVGNLVAGAGSLAGASAVQVTDSETIGAAGAVTLAGLAHIFGAGFSLGGHAITVSDTAPNLLNLAPAVLALVSATALSANATVDTAQFMTLRDGLNISLAGHVLTVSDNAGNLLGLSGSLASAGACVLSANATVTAANAAILAGEPAFSTGGHNLTIADTAANLLALPPSVQTLASVLDLAAPQSITAAQAFALTRLGGFNTDGHALTVTDTAGALAALSGGALALAGSELVSQSATISAITLEALAVLPNLSLAQGVTLTVQDNAANLLALPQAAEALATVVQLGANASVNVAQFDTLRDQLHVALNGYTLTVADTAANLLTFAGNTTLAGATVLTADANVSAAQAITLAAEPGFSTGGYSLSVLGNAAALLALPGSVLAMAGGLVLSGAQTVSAAQLSGLAALGGAFHADGHAITVADSPAALLGLSTPALALASAETVSQSAVVSATTLDGLAGLPAVTLSNGVVLTVTDSAANLLALPAPAQALAGAFQLSGDASVTAAQFAALRDTLHVSLNGHALTVLDSASDLVALANTDLSLAASCVLSGNATVSASQVMVLAAEPGFSTGGHVLVISDTAANLLALPLSLQLLADGLVLNTAQTVTAAQLTALASLGIEFSTAGHMITVSDTASALAGLSAPALALASSEVLNASVTVSAAVAASLAALPAFSVANGVTLTVQDSAANLLVLPQALLAVAGAESLLGGAVTLNAAQAAALASLGHFSAEGAAITVADTVADLTAPANLAWAGVTAVVNVVDSAANLAVSASTALLQNAAAVTLSGNAQIGVAQAVALDSIPHFSTGSAQLTVLGSATAIAAQAGAITAVASLVEVVGSGTVSAAQADQLATLSGSGQLVFLGGSQLQVEDSYAALTALDNAAGVALAARLTVLDTGANLALAAAHNWGAVNPSYVLSTNSLVSAAQAGALAGLGAYFSGGAYALVCDDTAANVLGLSSSAQALLAGEVVTQSATVSAAAMDALAGRVGFGMADGVVLTVQDSAAALLVLSPAADAAAGGFQLSGDATVSAAQFGQLRDSLHVALDGHVLTIADSAANLAAIAGSLALAGACVLSGSASINAAEAVTLAAEPGISTGGYVLTITDTADALLGLPAPVQALATGLVLAAAQSVSALQLTALAGLGGAFYAGGHAITVDDSATALAALGAPALALASTEEMNASATVNAATAETLAGLANLVLDSGVLLTVEDSATNLLALPASVLDVAGAIQLSGDATVSATQFVTLRDTLDLGLNGHVLTIADTASDLLALSGENLSLAGACVLNANASVSAAQASALAGEPGFSTGGYALTVTGTAAALLALPPAVQGEAAGLVLAGAQSVTAAQLAGLAALGGTFSTAGHALTVSDTATALAALSAPALALASGEVLDQSATVGLATVAALAALPALTLANGVTLTVQDSATNLLALSAGELALVSACVLSGDACVTAAHAAILAAEPGFSVGGYLLTITGTAQALLGLANGVVALAGAELMTHSATLDASDAAALALLPNAAVSHGVVLTVQDTAANLLALPVAAQALAGAYLLSADATVNAAQFEALRDTLHVALSGHVLTIDDNAADLLTLAGEDVSLAATCVLSQDADVNAAQATALAGEPGFSTGGHALTIIDTAADLLALGAPVQALATALVLAAPQSVTATQLTSLADLGNGFSAAGNAITITDTAANLVALGAPALALASAEILGQSAMVGGVEAGELAALPNFSLANGVTLTVDDTAAALLGLAPAVTAVATAYELSANASVDAADFVTLRDTLGISLGGHVLTITDSASNLLELSGENLSLAGACVLNANATVGYWQAEDLAAEPGFSAGSYLLTVADSANNLLSLPNSVLAVAAVLEVNGNQLITTNELTGLAALGSQFTANGCAIVVEGTAAQLLTLSAPALALATGEILGQSAVIDAATAQALVGLGNLSLDNGVTLTVDDTASALLALPQAVLALATGFELSANAVVDASDFTTLRDTLGVTANGHVLTISDSAANLLALAGGNLALAGACVLNADASVSASNALTLGGEPGFSAGAHVLTITSDAATIVQDLPALQADFGGFGAHLAITLTDQSPLISVSATTYAADSAILDAITNPAVVTVTDTAANVAAVAPALAADAQVAQVNVSDSALDVVENLTGLLALGSKLAVTLTDQAPLAASLVPFLVQLDHLTTSVGVSDTASQIASVVERANGDNAPAAITFLETNGVSLSGVSEVSVADLAALEQLGNSLNLNGNAIYVYDTASHLSTSGAAVALAAAENDGLISGAYVKAPGGVLTVNAATAATLFTVDGITAGYPPPQNGTISITVADTAANIDAHHATLANLLLNDDVSSVVVNANATISDAVLSDLQALGAVPGDNVTLTVHDSAATIAQNAGLQLSSQTISAGAWTLNGNATISEAQAVVLGSLSHFSAAGYTLTLNLNANTTISISDANALGNIAVSLNLNNHELLVAGNVAQLASLSGATLAFVSPELTDTLGNISTLSAGSALLTGTVTVNDSESISAALATSFLGLIASGGGPGIAIGNLNFGGQTETVTGSVAQLQALTASTAWTNSTAVHGAFALTASDSVAALINSANTSFLSGLHGTTLAADTVVNAADAETLAGVEAQINFNLGGHTLIVDDSAANLVALQNAAGVAMASSVVVAAPATLDAFDAETLLSNSHLVLNTSLTIQDASANLLDGTLMTDIINSGDEAHIQLQLVGPETLDAQTAASLVALPGFDDTQNLTIADSSAYLLASASLAAEDQAVAVTLAGDETVSANTVLRLSEVPHFTVGDNLLTLAGNDFANAATLKAIADLGTQFSDGGHTITATADALNLTPTEYAALQNDGIVANGHAISAVLVDTSVTDLNNLMALTATGVAGATVNIYDSSGNPLSNTVEAQSGFTITAPDSGLGHAFSITETVNGKESAPVVVLEANLIEAAVTAADATFATSGAIEVDSGKYLNLYTSTSVPQNLQTPALVYNAATHTISLDLPNASAVTLITLGASTHPASLDVSEILVKHHV